MSAVAEAVANAPKAKDAGASLKPAVPDFSGWGGLFGAIGNAVGGVIEAAGAGMGNRDIQVAGRTTRAIFTPGSDVSGTVKGDSSAK